MINRILNLCLLLLLCSISIHAQKSDEEIIRSIYDEALSNGQAHDNLAYLCKVIGGRLTGSPQAEEAVQWGKGVMEKMALDEVRLQACMVPHWVRGEKEFAFIATSLLGGQQEVPICALGGSIGTGVNGITAEIIEVTQLEQLEQLGREKIEGKIVFYNRPMDPTLINTFHAYGGCVDQRSVGAIEAARFGALATLVRSMASNLDDFPHTGAMRYNDTVPKIPAVAISTNGAEFLSRLRKQDKKLKVHIRITSETLPDVESHNVIGEIRGTEFPDEIILVGGHLDSWDLGEGAHDDGAGVVQSLEAIRLLKASGIKPKRTIRVVLFMNEENGMRGAKQYEKESKEKGEFHMAAIESDRGGFTPRGFTVEGGEERVSQLRQWEDLLEPYLLNDINEGYGGVDISPLREHGTFLIGFMPDTQRYFDHHHSANDVFEHVNKRELHLGAASMASLIYLISEHGLVQNQEISVDQNKQ